MVSQDTAGNNRRVFAACHCSAPATALGQSLQVLCRRAGCEVRFDPKTDLIPIPTPVAACLLRTLNRRRPSRFIRLPRPTE
jgi:hypothetical protein